jgi:hypothetical protein
MVLVGLRVAIVIDTVADLATRGTGHGRTAERAIDADLDGEPRAGADTDGTWLTHDSHAIDGAVAVVVDPIANLGARLTWHRGADNPFVGVEFIVPGEEVGANPECCVLCSRASTQQLFYDIVFDGVVINALIQRYGNIHGIANEYSQDVMLICPPNGPVNCMPLPIVSHNRNRYSVVKVGGVRWIRQHGVHFQ